MDSNQELYCIYGVSCIYAKQDCSNKSMRNRLHGIGGAWGPGEGIQNLGSRPSHESTDIGEFEAL